uniref:uncharacterized protein C6orf136 homolog isoform X2 n=1 Tax=Myxine glutinosa TaxID=7769 RepID=UPI00358E370B
MNVPGLAQWRASRMNVCMALGSRAFGVTSKSVELLSVRRMFYTLRSLGCGLRHLRCCLMTSWCGLQATVRIGQAWCSHDLMQRYLRQTLLIIPQSPASLLCSSGLLAAMSPPALRQVRHASLTTVCSKLSANVHLLSIEPSRSDPRSFLLFSPLQPSALNLVPLGSIQALCLDDIVIRHATDTSGIWQDPKISCAITDTFVEVLSRTLVASHNTATCAVWADVQTATLSLACLQKGDRSPALKAGLSQNELLLVCSSTPDLPKKSSDDSNMEEHLANMHNALREELPRFFVSSHNFSIYSENLVFINNILHLTIRGLLPYRICVKAARLVCSLYFIHAKVEVLSLDVSQHDSTVQARWRLRALPFHVLPLYLFQQGKASSYRTYDAYSTFYVGHDGLVHCHKLDKLMPVPPMPEKRRGPLLALFGLLQVKESQPALSCLDALVMNLMMP